MDSLNPSLFIPRRQIQEKIDALTMESQPDEDFVPTEWFRTESTPKPNRDSDHNDFLEDIIKLE